MRKKLIALSLLAMSSAVATDAMAEVGFQFRVPFQVTSAAGFTNVTGTSTLLTFDVDASTTVGVLNENLSYMDTKGGLAAAGTTTVSALRMQKNITDVVNVGLDFGHINHSTAASVAPATVAAAAAGSGQMADVFGGAKLASSKGGKVSSYMNAELLYRFAKTNIAAANENNLGGVQLSIAAGVNF